MVAAIGAASASIAGRPAYFVVLVFSAVFAYTACGLWASMQGGEWIALKRLIKQLTDLKLDGEVIRFSLLRPEASATIPSPERLLEDWREHVRGLFDTHLRLRSYRNHVLDDSGDRISKPLETLDLVLSELKQLYRP